MLTRQRQAALKIESIEGTAESLAAEDAKINAYDPKISFEPDMSEREVAGIASSRLSRVPGKRAATFKLGMHVSGSGTATTDPEWIKYLRVMGFSSSSLSTITVGAISNGPFQHGETITGGTSGATGRVIKDTVNGTTTLYFVPVGTLTFQNNEVITGGTSGATATTGSVPSAVGKVMEPLTDGIPCATVSGYEAGIRKLLKGSRGSKMKFNFKTGKICMIDAEYKGVEAGVTTTALLSNVAREDKIPPAFLSAALTCDGVAFKLSELSIDIENKTVAREDPSDSRGICSFAIAPPQKITLSMDPEMLALATHDFHSKLFNGTEMIIDFTLGSSTGNKYEFYGPKLQYSKVDDDQREGLAVVKITADFNGHPDRNDAFAILQL